MLKHAEVFTFMGYDSTQSECDIRIYYNRGFYIVIASERKNTAMSVHFAEEIISALIVKEYEIDKKLLIWIEHYPKELTDLQIETFNMITFHWKGDCDDDPIRETLNKEEVEACIGITLNQKGVEILIEEELK